MLLTLFIIAIVLIAAMGIYCIAATHNMIRVLIALELLIKAVTLLLALAGTISKQMALAQSFIIALIIIEVVVTATGAGIAIAVHNKNGSLDMRKLTKIKG
ncbi:MAG: NADH-quinone oxidoreductase subunit K [Defluviitaleaceae bacterium]|nr:NADH-quinone oxidoreductase subunit K [Defluviitaleaceae bacterium]